MSQFSFWCYTHAVCSELSYLWEQDGKGQGESLQSSNKSELVFALYFLQLTAQQLTFPSHSTKAHTWLMWVDTIPAGTQEAEDWHVFS